MDILIKKVSLKTNAGIQEWLESHPGCQVVDPGVTGGPTHIKHSVIEVLKAFEQGRNIARTKELEFLLRLVGERQVSKAVSKACVKNKEAVFVSWVGKDSWRDFKACFVSKEREYTDLPEDRLLDMIEKSTLFWMIS